VDRPIHEISVYTLIRRSTTAPGSSQTMFILALPLLIARLIATASCLDTNRPATFIHGHYILGNVFHLLELVGPQMCLRGCKLRTSCIGVNYNKDGLVCELLSMGPDTSPANMAARPGWSYGDIDNCPTVSYRKFLLNLIFRHWNLETLNRILKLCRHV
jgi:hypothetical protein